jgi:hypothetical protein
MRRRPILIALALALATTTLSAAPVAHADPPSTTVFDAVDMVQGESSRLTVTGLVAGQPTTKAWLIYGSSGDGALRCERMALLAMSKPGKYTFSVIQGTSIEPTRCQLALTNP